MEANSKMNMSLVNANIKLQDENKILKNDNVLLQKRMNNAATFLRAKYKNFLLCDTGDDIETAIDILEGNYVYEEKKKK